TDLLRYVELVQPQRVLTLHGFAAEFAADLRGRGIDAWALSAENQLELNIHHQKPVTAVRPERPTPQESEFGDFAKVGDAIGATPAKLKKIGLLAEYLRDLGPDQLEIATVYLTGKALAQSDPRTLQVGWSIIHRALTSA